MKNIFSKTRIVLVGTTHPGNIGAAARAMKTMSQDNLYLVNPKIFPSAEASARATGADDILANAAVCSSLKDAIADCDLVIGTSARTRSLPWPMVTPSECAEKVADSKYSSVAVVFGRENSGLTNGEIELCNLVLQIPTNEQYSSLNLAAAVQIICYEIYLLRDTDEAIEVDEKNDALVNQDNMEMFYKHLEETMCDVGYYNTDNPRQLSHRMRRLFNRALLEKSELNILRGFLSSIQNGIKK